MKNNSADEKYYFAIDKDIFHLGDGKTIKWTSIDLSSTLFFYWYDIGKKRKKEIPNERFTSYDKVVLQNPAWCRAQTYLTTMAYINHSQMSMSYDLEIPSLAGAYRAGKH